MKHPKTQQIELIMIRDHLQRAHAIAKSGEHVVADEIQDAIAACNIQIDRCDEETKGDHKRLDLEIDAFRYGTTS